MKTYSAKNMELFIALETYSAENIELFITLETYSAENIELFITMESYSALFYQRLKKKEFFGQTHEWFF
ncbi:MAG TPA: hypothetical protein VFC69_04115 [Dysgonamonadaceae bacterium]|nr:hypothetical protein [Dysgonamonadaceae bacterium]